MNVNRVWNDDTNKGRNEKNLRDEANPGTGDVFQKKRIEKTRFPASAIALPGALRIA